MQAKVAGTSHFLTLYLHYILWPNKAVLNEMQRMQKVTLRDVYFSNRIISFISKVNARFLLEMRMERLKGVQKGIGLGFPKGNCYILKKFFHTSTQGSVYHGRKQKDVGAEHHTKVNGTGARYLSAYPAEKNYL